jgi:two-component system sensor histidine kinase TctE
MPDQSASRPPRLSPPATVQRPLPPRTNPLRRPDEQRSLFGEILDWMLAPLLVLWPMSVTLTFVVAQQIASPPYDRKLAETASLIADHVVLVDDAVQLKLGIDVAEVLRPDSTVTTAFMVLGLRGELVAGDPAVPLPLDEEAAPGAPRLRLDKMHGSEVRIAYTWTQLAVGPPVLIQVVESLEARTQLANEIIKGVIVPQFIVLPLALLLVWLALTRGLAPLTSLQARIRRRRPEDRSPIDARAAPEEIAPLVESFNDLLARLSASIQVQKRFIADAAHQMKTPLAGLRTQSELALRQTDAEELKRSLHLIAAGSDRATRLINQLLALARAEHRGAEAPVMERVDLAGLVRETVRDWVPQAIERQIDLGVDVAAEPCEIAGAPLMLREMLGNLIDNALRYTPAGGSVTARVLADGSDVVLEVEDTGAGIPEAERARVFDRFYRVLGTNVEGSGLGLAIVREIVEQHDATVGIHTPARVPTAASPGALFRVRFRALAQSQAGAGGTGASIAFDRSDANRDNSRPPPQGGRRSEAD